MKNAIRVVFLITTMTLVFGCKKMLDLQPLGSLNESILTTKESINKLLIAAYSPLNGYIPGVWGITSAPDNCFFGDMGAGNIHKGSLPADLDDLMTIERFNETADNGRLLDKWILVYGGIERCNDVLRALKNDIKDLSAAEKTEIIAEARFLRGYYHLEAKKMWNKVPYLDENVEDPQRRVANDKDIWPNIEADYSYAAANLPGSQIEPGRPTRWAAQASLASAYLFQQKYSNAKTLLDSVITSGKYQLMQNYYDVFNAEKNNNIEVVWSNQLAVNVAGANYDRSARGGDLAFPNAPDIPSLSGAGFNQPTFDLVNAYKTDVNGLPLIDTYYQNDFKNDMGLETSDAFSPDMTTPVDPRLDWVVGRRGVPYHDWATHPGKNWIRDQNSAGPYNQKKYVILKSQLAKYAFDNAAKFSALNVNIIRYAKVLLWAAECEVEIGNPEKAREYVNMIRARARDGYYVRLGTDAPFGNGPKAANYQIDIYKDSWGGQSKDWLRTRVRFESRLEFANEGHLFFDLVRWGIAKEYINAYLAREKKNITYLQGVTFDDNHSYYPIPRREIERSYINNKPTLTQNPGY